MNQNLDERIAVALERIGKVLAALYADRLSEFDQGGVALRLRRCGFSNTEIADILGTTANTVNVALHLARKKSKKKLRKAKESK